MQLLHDDKRLENEVFCVKRFRMAQLFRGSSFGSGLPTKEVFRESLSSGICNTMHRSLSAENGLKSDEDSFEDAAEVRVTGLLQVR